MPKEKTQRENAIKLFSNESPGNNTYDNIAGGFPCILFQTCPLQRHYVAVPGRTDTREKQGSGLFLALNKIIMQDIFS